MAGRVQGPFPHGPGGTTMHVGGTRREANLGRSPSWAARRTLGSGHVNAWDLADAARYEAWFTSPLGAFVDGLESRALPLMFIC